MRETTGGFQRLRPVLHLLRAAGGTEGVDLVSGSRAHHEFPRHFHEEIVVTVVTQGEERIALRSRTLTAGAGSLVVLAPGVVHANLPAAPGGFAYRSFFLAPGLLEDAVRSQERRALESLTRAGAWSLKSLETEQDRDEAGDRALRRPNLFPSKVLSIRGSRTADRAAW